MLKRVEIWVTIVLSALYVYLSVIVWKKQGFDVTLYAVGFIATIVLWSVLIVTIIRTRTGHVPHGAHPLPLPKAKTKEEWTQSTGKLKLVANQKFIYADVPLDGRHYFNCSFEHVRFWYDGTQPSAVEGCTFDTDSKRGIQTHNPVLSQWSQILHSLGLLGENVKIGLEPFND